MVLPISEKYISFSENVVSLLQNENIACEFDDRSEKIGKKIRDAEMQKIPFMLIVGEKEQQEGKVSVRRHGVGDMGSMLIQDFIQFFKDTIQNELAK